MTGEPKKIMGFRVSCAAAISKPSCPLRVMNDRFAMFAQCRLVLQLQTYRCVAANGRNGPVSDIVRLVRNERRRELRRPIRRMLQGLYL